jgi:hypothetical protein
MHKDLVTSERGGPSPYRAVKLWLLLLLLLLLLAEEMLASHKGLWYGAG